MVKTFPALAALVVATALVTPTVGQAAETNLIRVSYADLNLVESFGQNQLERRIAYAAETVCGTADPRDLIFVRAVTDCRDGTVADARPAYEAAVASARDGTVTVIDGAALIVTVR